ncbi:unnamed protein product [Acanthosepion pharaonis]|uniref:Uncharacterized protein n=1 Tax=Acanthosepion pharaonis TaxID=158019 RepID=A0A812EKY7_ACAPH|nr:unnamed protein product [Sepia pharaonis]
MPPPPPPPSGGSTSFVADRHRSFLRLRGSFIAAAVTSPCGMPVQRVVMLLVEISGTSNVCSSITRRRRLLQASPHFRSANGLGSPRNLDVQSPSRAPSSAAARAAAAFCLLLNYLAGSSRDTRPQLVGEMATFLNTQLAPTGCVLSLRLSFGYHRLRVPHAGAVWTTRKTKSAMVSKTRFFRLTHARLAAERKQRRSVAPRTLSDSRSVFAVAAGERDERAHEKKRHLLIPASICLSQSLSQRSYGDVTQAATSARRRRLRAAHAGHPVNARVAALHIRLLETDARYSRPPLCSVVVVVTVAFERRSAAAFRGGAMAARPLWVRLLSTVDLSVMPATVVNTAMGIGSIEREKQTATSARKRRANYPLPARGGSDERRRDLSRPMIENEHTSVVSRSPVKRGRSPRPFLLALAARGLSIGASRSTLFSRGPCRAGSLTAYVCQTVTQVSWQPEETKPREQRAKVVDLDFGTNTDCESVALSILPERRESPFRRERNCDRSNGSASPSERAAVPRRSAITAESSPNRDRCRHGIITKRLFSFRFAIAASSSLGRSRPSWSASASSPLCVRYFLAVVASHHGGVRKCHLI